VVVLFPKMSEESSQLGPGVCGQPSLRKRTRMVTGASASVSRVLRPGRHCGVNLVVLAGEFCEFYNSLIDKISNVTRGVRNVASMRRKSHHTRRRRRSSDQSLGSVGIPVATPRAAPRTEASTPPVVSRVEVKESGAVTTVPAHVEKAQPPPRPELIRFDSISDEIAAYERGEIAAPSAEVVEDTRVACKTCGRKFVPKSIARHERICAKAAANAKRRGKFRVTRVRR